MDSDPDSDLDFDMNPDPDSALDFYMDPDSDSALDVDVDTDPDSALNFEWIRIQIFSFSLCYGSGSRFRSRL